MGQRSYRRQERRLLEPYVVRLGAEARGIRTLEAARNVRAVSGLDRASLDPELLVSSGWMLIKLVDHLSRVAPSPSGCYVVRFGQSANSERQYVGDNCGHAAFANIGEGWIEIGTWATDLMFYPEQLSQDQLNSVIGLLRGHLTWSIVGDELTMLHPEDGALVFRRVGETL